jgi:hypothetical protein
MKNSKLLFGRDALYSGTRSTRYMLYDGGTYISAEVDCQSNKTEQESILYDKLYCNT